MDNVTISQPFVKRTVTHCVATAIVDGFDEEGNAQREVYPPIEFYSLAASSSVRKRARDLYAAQGSPLPKTAKVSIATNDIVCRMPLDLFVRYSEIAN